MRKRIGVLLTFAATLLATAPAWSATPNAGHLRVAIDSASRTADFTQTADRNGIVILHEWERDRMRALKAANPALRVLVYKNLSFMAARDQWGNASTGVTTQEAATHPQWFLLDTDGRRISSGGYSWLWAADIGDPSYQATWAENVLEVVQRDGWDGVFADDTNPTMRYHHPVGRVARYPSDSAYSAATGSALALIGPRLRAAGKLVMPNFGSWRTYRSTVEGWLRHVSGGMEEHFTKWGTTATAGYFLGADWEANLASLKTAQAQGKEFLAVSHSANADAAAARYGWATVLLGGEGSASFALHGDYTTENWFPEYEYDLGAAQRPEERLASGVHRRLFARGLVLVNPTAAGVAVPFGGSYSGSGLTRASSATMPPHTALILTADAAPAPAPAPEPAPGPEPIPEPTPAPEATPVPEPAPAPDPAERPRKTRPSKPKPTARLAAARGSRAKVVTRLRCAARRASCRQRVVLRISRRDGSARRGATVGRRRVALRAGAARRVFVKLSRRGRAALAAGHGLRVSVRRA
jgi:hypothetical protein